MVDYPEIRWVSMAEERFEQESIQGIVASEEQVVERHIDSVFAQQLHSAIVNHSELRFQKSPQPHIEPRFLQHQGDQSVFLVEAGSL